MAGQSTYTEKDIEDLTSLLIDVLDLCDNNKIGEIKDMLRERLDGKIPTSNKTEMPGQFNYTEKDIDDLASLLIDAIDLQHVCDSDDSDYDEVETLENIKDMFRERLRIPTRIRIERKKKLQRLMKTNEEVRRQLGYVYEELKTFFQPDMCGEDVISEIDVTFPSCRTAVSRNDELLRRGCRVLLVGEHNAGKSSLLKVLIGSPILPIDHRSCTPTIHELVRSDPEDASIEKYRLDHLGGQQLLERIQLDTKNPKSVRKTLARYHSQLQPASSQLLARGDEMMLRLHWPIPMLPENVLLVDSPGCIGENVFFDEQVTSYLHKTDAVIFIINANAGGQKTLHDMKKLLNCRTSSERNRLLYPDGFTLRHILFILNKMDQVSKKERCRVRQWWIKHIKQFWPGIDEEKQVLSISVFQIRKKLKLGLVETEEHWKLLDAIYSLIETCTAASHKRWLSVVCGRIRYLLQSKVIAARTRSEELMEIRECIKKNLQQTSDEEVDLVIKTSALNFQRRLDRTAAALLAHLTDETTVEAIAEQCLVADQKTKPFLKLMDEIRRRCQKLIDQAVTQEIREFEPNTLLIDAASSLVEDLHIKLKGWSTFNMPEYRTYNDHCFPTVDDLLFPKRAAGAPTRLVRKFTGRDSTEFREYTQNPRQYMLKLTREAVSSLTFENIKKKITRTDPIELFKTQVPLLREANLQLLSHIEADISKTGDLEHRNSTLLKFWEAIFYHLQYVKLRYPELDETDVYPISEVNMEEDIGRGSIGVVQVASVVLKGEQKSTRIAAKTKGDITVQTADEFFRERDALRLLTHENVVKYIGTSITESGGFVVLTELCKCNLSDLIFSHQVPVPGQQNEQVGFLVAFRGMVDRAKQIANGLAYIHSKGVIHGDLQVRNILVTNSGVLKLSDMNQEARGQLNLHSEMSKADVYSLGIVLYELWFGLVVYSDAIVFKLIGDIRRDVRKPSFEVKGYRCPIPEWRKLLEGCWKDTAFERVSSSDVHEELGKMLSKVFLES